MRIVVSGTHASGKSTLVSDFTAAHPEYTALPDPFELIDETWDSPSAAMFAAQLRLSADRLIAGDHGQAFIAERGPLDFLAYLLALAELSGGTVGEAILEQATELTVQALSTVDLLVLLPLAASDPIQAGDDEHLELREATDQILLELADDPDLVGPRLTVAEITGDPGSRLAALDSFLR